MEKINERIRNLRRASGKSQTEIAECSGMSRTGYASIEQGVTIKTFEKLPAIAKALGCRSVAEGIEHPEQLEALRKTGCDIVQGFVFYKPMLPEDFERVVFKGEKIVQQ